MGVAQLFLLFFSVLVFTAPDAEKINYIEKYKDLAIVEMYRSGIPASITLAQALHESNAGRSPLALEANNHFGIKCKTYWTGGTYYYEDDDLDRFGNLVESCFRSYATAVESYVDHSNFLMESERYSPLFALDKNDFASWAWGLKECGYATDPDYAVKLIKIIYEYDLSRFDQAENPFEFFKGAIYPEESPAR